MDRENPTTPPEKPLGGFKVPSGIFLRPLGPAWESLWMALANH